MIALLVLNLSSLSYVIYHQNSNREDFLPPNPPKEIFLNRLIEKLSLREDQTEVFIAMVNDHRRELEKIDKKLRKEFSAYILLIDKPDSKMLKDSVENGIVDLQRKKSILTYEHLEGLYKLCDENQKVAFSDFLPELSEFLGPRPKRQPNGPPPDHDRPPRDDHQNGPPPNEHPPY